MFINFVEILSPTINMMDKNELKKQLIHKKMEAKALIEVFRILDAKRYERDLNKLLDRINEIDKILNELDK